MLAKDLSSFGEDVKINYFSKIANISIKETIGTIGLLFFLLMNLISNHFFQKQVLLFLNKEPRMGFYKRP